MPFAGPLRCLVTQRPLRGSTQAHCPRPSLQEHRGHCGEVPLDQAWHCRSLGREKYWGTEFAEGCLESGWNLSADQLNQTKGSCVGPGSGSPCFARRQAGDWQHFGRVMSKAERSCLAFISETQAVESRAEKHLCWLLKGTHVTQRYAMLTPEIFQQKKD